MKVELKTWGALGLATALAGAGLAGCSDEMEPADPGSAAATSADQAGGEGGEAGEAGEGGETGEGGVAIDEASSDPVVYRSALAVAQAHAIAARDAFEAGRTEAAAEMFAHPVSEVLADMDPVFAERGVEDFKPLFIAASTGVIEGESEDRIAQRFDAIMTALDDAAQKAPDNGASEAAVAAGVAANMVDRAVRMYREASSSDRYEPYLDGYGFYRTASELFDQASEGLESENADFHEAMEKALALLESAYPGAERPANLDVNQAELFSAASQVMLRQ